MYQEIDQNIKYPKDTESEKIDKIVDLCVLGDAFIRYVFHKNVINQNHTDNNIIGIIQNILSI